MILTTGSRVGHYEIVAPLGAGGMGEVYRARDPRIAREVAVKILPPAFAENADRLHRFEQEARASGAVNHPNLLTVFDVGTHEGLPFIVSELLEGATLRDRIRQPLPPRRAIEYARQIARGVGAAHEKGIVHRDLKPDNIFITDDERVKLLDFGLAKLLRTDVPAEMTAAQTARQNTAEGAVLGTVAYMSPEQVRGQSIDHRTDVFSFGVVLYEMLAGARPFNATSNVETMASIINDDPPPLPASTPPQLERIVLHAMEKSAANRFQSMKDVVFALDTFSGSGETSPAAAKPKSRTRAAKKELRFERVSFRRGFVWTARFAPDGSVIYGAAWEDQPLEVFSAIQGNPESRPAGLPNSDILAVSPTGELALSIGRRFVGGWVTAGTLARAPLFGGAPRELSENIQDADWTADGKQLAVIRHTRDGHVIELPLGTPLFESEHWISNLRLSPRGGRLAFLEHDLWGDDGGRVVIMDHSGARVAESERWHSIGALAWTPSGDEVWLAAQEGRGPRDLRALSVSGKERVVLPVPARLTLHDIAKDGRALVGIENARREILVGTRGDERERNLSWLDWSFLVGLSPDGSRIAFEEQIGGRRGDTSSVYVRKVDGSAAVRLSEGVARAFSPDGMSIAVQRPGADYLEIVPIGVGTGHRVSLGGLAEAVWWDWTPDGRHMVVWGHEAGGGKRHFLIAIDGSAPPRPISPSGATDRYAIAPDSARLVMVDADGRLIIVPFDGGEPQPVAGSEAGDRPVQWSADGGSIFVYKPGRVEVAIDRIDLRNGSRSRWQVLRPADPAGIMDIMPIHMTRDGEKYAYSYRRFMSDLYIVEGLA